MELMRPLTSVLSLLLLAAHLLRWGGPLLLLPALAALALPFLRAAWAPRLLQGILALSCLEWLRAAWGLAAERQAAGLSSQRMLAILLAVAALTGWAAWLAPRGRGRTTKSGEAIR